MHIVVLTKPVPDPAAGAERLGPGPAARPRRLAHRRQRQRRVRARGGAPAGRGARRRGRRADDGPRRTRTETMRKALAMGAARGIHVTDPALEGADLPTTIRVLAAAAKAEPLDLLLAGIDTSDGMAGAVAAGVAARLGLPLLSAAAAIEPDPAAGTRPRPPAVRQGLRPDRGPDARGRRVHPGPGRAALPVAQGDHGRPLAARSRAARWATSARTSPADGRLGHAGRGGGPAAGAGRRTGRPVARRRRRARDRRLPRRPEDHLMPATILAVAEVADGALTKLSTEVATLARTPRGGGGRDGRRAGRRRATRRGCPGARDVPPAGGRGGRPGRRGRGRRAPRRRRGGPAARRGRHARRARRDRPTAATWPGRSSGSRASGCLANADDASRGRTAGR